MSITIGTQLNSLEVTALLGKGGMGEVYRARDSKLKREVAIKTLPTEFSRDSDRLARFQREAEVLASLNHPNIAAIYDLQESATGRYLVMELVEGETIADRLQRGPIPLEDALLLARGICDALEAAHEQGIVHRDLKPANVKVTPDGRVKVLDFGLAKIHEPAAASAAVSNSPTLSALQTGGIILGTAAYMSPEQARGKAVDKRTDVWAFGCVLYEMLTGARAFDGDDVTDIIAAVVRAEPDWNKLPGNTPSGIRRLLRRCLEKDRRERLPEIATARLDIKEAIAPTAETDGVASTAVHQAPARPPIAAWLLAALFAASSVAMLVVWKPWRTAPPASAVRASVELGADVSLAMNIQGNSALALSADGSVLAFVGEKGGASQIYVRRLDQLQAMPLTGTNGAMSPFFSPDGHWIGFFADAKLKKISASGGAAITLCDAPSGRGGAWGEDNNILFHPNSGADGGLLRVASGGGVTEPLPLEKGDATHRWPQVLPGARAVLYTANATRQTWDEASIVVRPLPSGAPKVLVRGGYHGQYVESGHLLYIHDGTLFTVPFDAARLEVTGQAVPVAEGVAAQNGTGAAQFAVSRNGTFVNLLGSTTGVEAPILWMTRDGKTSPLRSAPSAWGNPHFSPDSHKLAIDIFDGRNLDVWIYDLLRDTPTRLTFDATPDSKPEWTPDGRRIVFTSSRNKEPNLYWQASDGSSDAERLTQSLNLQLPGSWHPNGKYFAFTETATQSGDDLMILPMEGDATTGWKPGKPYAFLNSPATEREPMFSPDGKWIAYHSNESGVMEVFVRPFPGPGGKWQISTAGGITPTWSRKSHELLYMTLDNRIMSVSYSVQGDSFVADKPTVWSSQPIELRPRQRSYDLDPNGDRIATYTRAGTVEEKRDKVVFIFNFFDELRRLAPPRK